MSPGTGASSPSQPVLARAEESGLRGVAGEGDVQGVQASPAGTTAFGAYLVPGLVPARPDALLSVKDVARRWGVCTATVYGLAKRGCVPCLRVGNSIRFRLEQIKGYERSREAAGSERRNVVLEE